MRFHSYQHRQLSKYSTIFIFKQLTHIYNATISRYITLTVNHVRCSGGISNMA